MAAVLDRAGLDRLIGALIAAGYRVIGPTVRDSAIVLAEIESGSQLPDGWGVEVAPGSYRLKRRRDAAVFSHSAGPQSWKQFLHPPKQPLWSDGGRGTNAAGSTDSSAVVEHYTPPPAEPVRYAFLGVRACDLAAIHILGTVLAGGAHPDSGFTGRRDGLLVIAVGCTEPGGVCFCASMGTGPAPGPGYDLCLTERLDADGHRFLVEVGTPAGEQVLATVPHRQAHVGEIEDAHVAVADAADRMGRQMPAGDLRALLRDSRESPPVCRYPPAIPRPP